MAKGRSKPRIVHSAIEVKAWLERTPSVDEVRPGQCPRCRAASRPLGRSLSIWGHGLRERQQRGPLEPSGESVTVTIAARRYVCRPCRAVILVVPLGVVAGHLFSAAAIALALVLFGVRGESLAGVRARISPWRRVGEAACTTWLTVRRWVCAIREQRLFACVREAPARWTARQVAERAATTLAALVPAADESVAIEARVFAGAPLAR